MARIAVPGTLDSEGEEHGFLADIIRGLGHVPLLIDVGTTGKPSIEPDVRVTGILSAFSNPVDRGTCVAEVAKAVPAFVTGLAAAGRIDAVISPVGGVGTSIATALVRALPLRMPKIMVSTLASGNTAHCVGTSDISMIPSVVDVAGLNRVSRTVFAAAAHAVCAMSVARESAGAATSSGKPMVVASMFGNTTGCVEAAKTGLESAGFEVLVFHATGAGGRTMESIVASGMVVGVHDITTTEIADEVVGGVLSAGPSLPSLSCRSAACPSSRKRRSLSRSRSRPGSVCHAQGTA